MIASVTETLSTVHPLFVPAATGTALELGDQRGNIAVSAQFTGDAFSLIVLEAAPGASVPPHVHVKEDETFYILGGRFAGEINGEHWEAGPGDVIYGPRNIIHAWRVVSETGGKLALFITPGANFEEFFTDMSGLIMASQVSGVVELGARLNALAESHGIYMLPESKEGYVSSWPSLSVPAGGGLRADLGDHEIWGKIGAHQTESGFLMSEARVDKNGGVPPHVHHREEETFYILEGRFRFLVGDQVIVANPGDTVFAPRDVMHSFQCISDGGGRMLLFMTPGANFQAFCGEMAARNIVPSRDMADPVIMQEFMALTVQYGIDMLPVIK